MRYCVLIVLGALSAGLLADEPTSQPAEARLPFAISKETTFITQPLLPNGCPDYASWLNAEFGKGVTQDNNAVVLMLEAVGPDVFDEEYWGQMLKALDMELSESGPGAAYFSSYEGDGDDTVRAMEGPWTKDDLPDLAKWLDSQERFLDLAVEANRRPRWYVPALVDGQSLWIELSSIGIYSAGRNLAKALAMRANRQLAADCGPEAIEDVLTIVRLGKLMQQDPLLIGQLVAMAITSLGNTQMVTVVREGQFDGPTLENLLEAFPPTDLRGAMRRSVVEGERLFMLSILTQLAADPEAITELAPMLDHELAFDEEAKAEKLPEIVRNYKAIAPRIDYDELLRVVNQNYDGLGKALAGDEEARKILKRYGEAFEASHKAGLAKTLAKLAQSDDADHITREFTAQFCSDVPAAFGRAMVLARRTDAYRDLARLAIALEIYRKKQGQYPASLAALSPKIIKAVPVDPFNDKPLVYRVTEAGYVLYSVGSNGEDDGGKMDWNDGDIVISVPPQRDEE